MIKFTRGALTLAAVCAPVTVNAHAYVQVETSVDVVHNDLGTKAALIYGGSAGFDVALSKNLYAGVEASYDHGSARPCMPEGDVPRGTICENIRRETGVTGHIGTKLNDTTRLYALAGYNNGHFRRHVDIPGVIDFKSTGNGGGYRVGAGARRMLSQKLFTKIEYRFAKFDGSTSRHNAVIAIGLAF